MWRLLLLVFVSLAAAQSCPACPKGPGTCTQVCLSPTQQFDTATIGNLTVTGTINGNVPTPTVTIALTGYADFVVSNYASVDATFQAAMNSLPATGGKIYFFAGTYQWSVGGYLTKNNVMIEGDGMATLHQWKSSASISSATPIFDTNGFSYVVMKNFRMDGNRGFNTYGSAIRISGSTRVWLDTIYMENFQQYGVHLVGNASFAAFANKFTNLWIVYNNGYGIYCESYCYDTQITQVEVGCSAARCPNGTYGIYWKGGGDLMMVNAHVWGQNLHGMVLAYFTNQPTPTVGTLSKISNSIFETNGGYGLYLIGAYGDVVSNSMFWANGQSGLAATASRDMQLHANTFRNNVLYGLLITTGCTYFGVVGNNFFNDILSNDTLYAVRIDGGADFVTLAHNVMPASGLFTGQVSIQPGSGANLVAIDNSGYSNTLLAPLLVSNTITSTSNIISSGGKISVTNSNGTQRFFTAQTNGVDLWRWGITTDAQTGSNAGASWILDAMSDAGSFLTRVLTIIRSSGQATFGGLVRAPKFVGLNTPTITAGVAAGTGPTVSISGSDTAGTITVTVGTSPATGVLCTVTYGQANGGKVTLMAEGPNAAGVVALIYTGLFSGSFQVLVSSALTASTTYTWSFHSLL